MSRVYDIRAFFSSSNVSSHYTSQEIEENTQRAGGLLNKVMTPDNASKAIQ